MPFKHSPRALIAAIILCVIGMIVCFVTVGVGLGLLYSQRQMSSIIISAQAREDAHKLELDKVRLEKDAEWQKRVDEASTDDKKQQAQITKLTEQNETLIKSLDRLARSSEQRVIAAAKIQNKLDTVASKVDQVSDATPGVKKPTGEINRKIEDANRRLK